MELKIMQRSRKRPPLKPLLTKWQRALRLLDWDITVEYVDKPNKGEKEFYGKCECDRTRGTARIRILDPTVDPDVEDVEQTVKHELMHVKLWDIVKNNKHILPLEERFIQHIVPLLRCKPSK